MFEVCNLSCPTSSERVWQSIDEQRRKNGNYKMTIAAKERRKQKRRTQCKQQDAFQHAEGLQYKSSAFHATSTSKKASTSRKST